MGERRNWVANEVRAALGLYLVTDFGRIHNKNPKIIQLAGRIGRTPSAVAMKMSNLAGVDQSLNRKGLANASKLDHKIWAEFLDNPDRVIREYHLIDKEALLYSFPKSRAASQHFREGVDRKATVNLRVGQGYFRDVILTSYKSRCALTGLDEPKLLVASHIVGWAEDQKNRLNPQNGICLNALHDKAFDRHLITFDEKYRMQVSRLLPSLTKKILIDIPERELTLPERFLPSQELLEHHRKVFFDKEAA